MPTQNFYIPTLIFWSPSFFPAFHAHATSLLCHFVMYMLKIWSSIRYFLQDILKISGFMLNTLWPILNILGIMLHLFSSMLKICSPICTFDHFMLIVESFILDCWQEHSVYIKPYTKKKAIQNDCWCYLVWPPERLTISLPYSSAESADFLLLL